MIEHEWIPVKAKDVEQGRLFSVEKEPGRIAPLRRVFENGYLPTVITSHSNNGRCIVGTDDMMCMFIREENTVYVMKQKN